MWALFVSPPDSDRHLSYADQQRENSFHNQSNLIANCLARIIHEFSAWAFGRTVLSIMNFPFVLHSEAAFDVIGFGTNAVDHLIRVPAFPDLGSKMELTTYTRESGGEVASTMTGLQRLGKITAYVGRFGSDDEGEFGLRSLSSEGVDTSYTEKVDGAFTQIAFIFIDERSGERTILWKRDGGLAYSAADAPLAVLDSCRILHMTPHDTAACIAMARAAREKGIVVSLDIDNLFDGIDGLLPLVDVCIASAELPPRLTGVTDPAKSLSVIRDRYGCTVTGMTLGRHGSIVLCGSELIETPGAKVPGGCIDTTGAGDAFRTGFLFGLLDGRTVEETCVIANAVAALKCRGTGARSSLPDRSELFRFLGIETV
jgi:sulfofructose kinase